jgi:hypothetical protein
MRVGNALELFCTGSGAIRLAAALAIVALPLACAAQTAYHDPQGRYDLQVPAGWQVAPDQGVDQIIVRKGASQEIIAVIQQNKSNAMTAKQFVDETAKEFQGQCPTFKSVQSGTVTLAGSQGIYSLFTCNDPKSPAVAETSSTLTSNNVLVGLTEISPVADYYATLPVLDAIRDSLRVTGNKPAAAPAPKESLAMTELKKACAVGAFAQQDECSRRMGILLGQDAKQDGGAPQPVTGSTYHDPTGRFSLQVPDGWTAKSEGDNGILGVQLRSGNDWINVMPAKPAASASEVVLNQDKAIAAQSNSGKTPPFSQIGLLQIFGNGLEVSYDNFSASTAQGDQVESYIGGVGDISGTDHNFLLIITSISGKEKDKAGGLFLSVAQSIHLAGH